MESLVSNAERRAIILGDSAVVPRLVDLHHALPGMTGKIELVFEGEQEGAVKVSKALIGKAVRTVFQQYFPDPLQKKPRERAETTRTTADNGLYGPIVSWFEQGNKVEISDDMPLEAFYRELDRIGGLRAVTLKHLKIPEANRGELASAMEFVLEALHQCSKIAKDEVERASTYKDMVGSIFSGRGRSLEEDEETGT